MSSYPDVQMQSVLDHIRKYSNENSENSSNNIQNVRGYLLEKCKFWFFWRGLVDLNKKLVFYYLK